MAARTARGDQAKLAMILAGERLFAQRGPFAVSMREVGLAAGQKNNSAAKYHFGSKGGLINAILEHRMVPINERRLAMLADMAAQGRSEDLHSIMEAFFLPLIEAVGRAGKSTHYARFLSQVAFVPGIAVFDNRRLGYTSGWNIAWQGARRAADTLPEPVAVQRLQLISRLMITVLADQERLAELPSSAPSRHLAAPTDLLDVAVAMLQAPVSQSTLDKLAETEAPPGAGAATDGPADRRSTTVTHEGPTHEGPNQGPTQGPTHEGPTHEGPDRSRSQGRAAARPRSVPVSRKAFP